MYQTRMEWNMDMSSVVGSVLFLFTSIVMHLSFPLQQFVTVENIEKTKMGLENIAMVWAPNFLRCPSEDHTLIFQNTRKEMTYLRVLLQSLDTEAYEDEECT